MLFESGRHSGNRWWRFAPGFLQCPDRDLPTCRCGEADGWWRFAPHRLSTSRRGSANLLCLLLLLQRLAQENTAARFINLHLHYSLHGAPSPRTWFAAPGLGPPARAHPTFAQHSILKQPLLAGLLGSDCGYIRSYYTGDGRYGYLWSYLRRCCQKFYPGKF